MAGPGKRRVAADYRITVFEPNHRLAFETIAGPVRPSGAYLLEDSGDGTRLTFSLQAELRGIRGLLMGRLVQNAMDTEVMAIERLRMLLEAAPAT